MDEIIDFASVLMKLVIILTVMLMSCTLVVLPDTAMALAAPMLLLVVPLFVFSTALDLRGVFLPRSENSAGIKPLFQSRRG